MFKLAHLLDRYLMKHILINSISARRGGGQTYLINILKHLPANIDIKITLLVSSKDQIDIENPNIELFTINFPVNNPFFRAFWERCYLPAILTKKKVDVLFCPGGVVGTKAPKGCKTVTMFRNMIPFDMEQRRKYPLGYMRFRNWLLNRVMLKSMEKADLVIFISDFAKKVIESVSISGIRKSVVIPHGINDSFTVSNGQVENLPQGIPDSPYILYVSTIDVYKSQFEVVKAFAQLKARLNTMLKLVLVGAKEPFYTKKVIREVERLNLEGEVVFTGQIPYKTMPAVYKSAKMIVFASQSENCPNILLESMSSGKPIICSNMKPMPEFGGSAVLYFDPKNPDELTEKMEKLLLDTDVSKSLAEKSLKRARNYSWELTAKKTWNAMLDL